MATGKNQKQSIVHFEVPGSQMLHSPLQYHKELMKGNKDETKYKTGIDGSGQNRHTISWVFFLPKYK